MSHPPPQILPMDLATNCPRMGEKKSGHSSQCNSFSIDGSGGDVREIEIMKLS